MSKINRFDGNYKAFASEQLTNERTTFGTEVISDDLTAQQTPEYLRGMGIVGPSQFPTLQDFNAVNYAATQSIAYLHQMGVPEWAADQEYPTEGATCIHNGVQWYRKSTWTLGDEPGVSVSWSAGLKILSSVYDPEFANLQEGQTAYLKEYHQNSGVGGGHGERKLARHNGVTAISLTRARPTDWNDPAQLAAWFSNSGTTELCLALTNTSEINIYSAGANNTFSATVNKLVLQYTIQALNLIDQSIIVVNSDIDYGYVNNDINTYPDFSDATKDMTIVDEGIGDADGSGNKSGSQTRTFRYTLQTTPAAGMHNGNGTRLFGEWNPYFGVNNTANLAPVGNPSRTPDDNRRVSWLIENDGHSTWRFGQGTLAGAEYTNEELSNFVLEHYAAPGDTLPNYAPITIERKTGNWSFGGGSNAPEASYVFTSVTEGYPVQQLESLANEVTQVFRNANGPTEDIYVRNTDGIYSVFLAGIGEAFKIDRNRIMTVNAPIKSLPVTVANLTAASTAGVGATAFVTDSSVSTFGSAVVGGGSAKVPVYCDGVVWVVG